MQRLHKRNLDGPWYGLVYMYCRLCRLWKYATSQRRNGRNRVWPSLHVLQTLQFMVICNITREIWTDQDKDLPTFFVDFRVQLMEICNITREIWTDHGMDLSTFLQTLGYSLWKYKIYYRNVDLDGPWLGLVYIYCRLFSLWKYICKITTEIWTDHAWYGLVYIFFMKTAINGNRQQRKCANKVALRYGV